MNFYEIPFEGYVHTYTRTDFQIINNKTMKKIFRETKK